ncbi:D-alanyl-D-alanine carboxypeptidase [Halomonas sp. McH1-25]|uniref:D-alanyl-D-alanine carboxypeptidase n=1 Tax=unclassified Halomonas TaxID=2609666 RepID=UPI001EF7174C|nr:MULTISPECIES: D-alanyl-D-alanine carboxypeptidase [unclassified Halomonas]MCG7600242.1 D-alanyl-D-alanine carboxypeptidase [Halomonas sp. McH1-25]MCP1343115.1 D-alanyl-D-alanine carboxypeptidase [Halomonas sp. FL8]MCP1360476.1 D-alanyl-D-alanine carboxypeptidase [Halomonas sp. BBD45]
MAPNHSIATSRIHVVLLFCMLVSGLSLFASQAHANPRYASIVIDAQSGEVLSYDHADAVRYPASLTKMMTLYLLFEAIESGRLTMESRLPVSSHAAAQPPSKLWVRPGQTIAVKEAIPALIVKSANDVAAVVAEGLAGSESAFAERMTAKARALGMSSTTFRNASGLPDDRQVTTARDMATLSMHLMRDFPQYYGYFSRTQFVYLGKTYKGHNRLLGNYAGADGLKTGYIRASGFNVATSAVRDGRRIVSVVMGGFTAQSRDAHMAELLDRGFVRASLLTRGDWIAKTDVFGAGEAVSLATVDRTAKASMAVATAQASASAPVETAVIAQGDAQEDPIRTLLTGLDQGANAAGWMVQVGAFSNRDGAQARAHQAATALSGEFNNTRVSVVPANGERQMYRARLIDLEESQAHRSCQQLARQGMDCVVLRAGVGG